MHGDLIPVRSFWARFVSTLFSTLKDVTKWLAITTTKEWSSCFRKSMKKSFLEPPCLEITKSENHQNRTTFYSRYFRNFHVFWQFRFGWLQLREPSVCVTFRYSSLKNHHPSGTTMRRACELVARQGLLCRGASKIDVCSSVRSSVRSSAAFLDSFETGQMELPKAKRSKIGSKMVQKCDIETCDQIDAKRRHNRSWRATLLRGSI